MKIFTFSLILILSFNVFAQVKIKKRVVNTNLAYSEKFYVLDTNKNIRHGEYFKISNDNSILENGYYEFGKKVKNWRFFSENTLFLTYNFEAKKVVNYKNVEDSVIVKVGDKYLKIFPDIPLLPIASFVEIYSLIMNNSKILPLLYSREYMHNILIFIDKEGHFIEAKLNIPEQNKTSNIKIDGIESINWVPPMIGSQAFDSVFVLKLK
ncbi:hypothetical protein [Emticicia sp. SJ17W-69]|uniref:hypothetical protein n=1 Tax=Emticicia sp. SJ17W-69 TaxID=3421657 RepID=UPI003EBDDD8A